MEVGRDRPGGGIPAAATRDLLHGNPQRAPDAGLSDGLCRAVAQYSRQIGGAEQFTELLAELVFTRWGDGECGFGGHRDVLYRVAPSIAANRILCRCQLSPLQPLRT